MSFDPHAPARGATVELSRRALHDDRFDRRSRTGSDGGVRWRRRTIPAVSIHAPARGATAARWVDLLPRRVSIHAPARGATRRGHDGDHAETVSIHAPARGATFAARTEMAVTAVFRSTLPHGERQKCRICAAGWNRFIHAPARGATCAGIAAIDRECVFRSTLPHGERP